MDPVPDPCFLVDRGELEGVCSWLGRAKYLRRGGGGNAVQEIDAGIEAPLVGLVPVFVEDVAYVLAVGLGPCIGVLGD